MDTSNGKPRICEVLGVEVGEKFMFCGMEHYIDKYGQFTTDGRNTYFNSLVQAINDPSLIVKKHA